MADAGPGPQRPHPDAVTGIAPNGRPFESVWDYPRPPRAERLDRRVTVKFSDAVIAASEAAVRVCETAGAPTIYLPPEDVRAEMLVPAAGKTLCEFKGTASYLDVVVGDERAERAAWVYRRPMPGYEQLRDFISFYPSRVECLLDEERVVPQPGGFYGGWVTAEIAGPIKGEPGSERW